MDDDNDMGAEQTSEEEDEEDEEEYEDEDGDVSVAVSDTPDDDDIMTAPTVPQKKKSKLKKTSDIPTTHSSGGNPRARRLAKSYVVRSCPTMYPTEIFEGAGAFKPPIPLDGSVRGPLREYLDVLRNYMGLDPAALQFPIIEDRFLRSTKAPDESDSEHFQRLASTLQIMDTIKTSRVKTLQELETLGQRSLSEDRQHKRYSDVIRIKRDKNDSDVAGEALKQAQSEWDHRVKRVREDHLGKLEREVAAKKLRAELVSLDGSIPDRPMLGAMSMVYPPVRNFDVRSQYFRNNIK